MSKYIIDIPDRAFEDMSDRDVFIMSLNWKDVATVKLKDTKNLDDYYEQGLNDAWEAARKVCCFYQQGGLDGATLYELFGKNFAPNILKDFSASEVIEKLKTLED